MTNEQWTIDPLKRIGSFYFGMSPDQVSSFDPLYGPVTATKTYGNEANAALENLGPFAHLFSDSVTALAIDSAKKSDSENVDLREDTRSKDCYLRLDYRGGSLSAVTLDSKCKDLNFNNLRIFEHDILLLLQYLQKVNGDAKIFEQNIIFDRLGLMLSSFYYENNAGAWRIYSNNDDGFDQQFVTVFAASELTRYLTEDFHNIDFATK